ncbi:MAG: AAA family ATPase [Actinobacteria bacterium]|nr:AAA family ATPase [Actinomycetota bacterium]
MGVCAQCASENPEQAKFCLECGAPLASEARPRRDVRKTVTILFSDVVSSTETAERIDPETVRRVMDGYFDEAKAVIERHGGTVEKFIGDAVMAVFGVPVVHEDDALRAVRAAAELRERLATLNEHFHSERGLVIEIRTGVNTGEVVAGDTAAGQRFATGDAVNVAARLERACRPGEIMLGAATYRLVRDAVRVERSEPLALKGKAASVEAHRLLEVLPGVAGTSRRLDSPLVGRDHELNLLRDAFRRSARERTCHLFTVLGSAGIGKSRLAEEFVQEVGADATVLRGRCLAYGEGITFWPIVEAVTEAAGLMAQDSAEVARGKIASLLDGDDAALVAERLAELLGIGEPEETTEESFWAIRKLFEELAREKQLVVVFDDIHWAEPTFLDLVEHVADWSREAPILLVCLTRPELLDSRPGWAGGKLNATSMLLEPLTDGECGDLIEHLLGSVQFPEEARGRITEAAEGNPLFVEEMLAMLVDDGLLRRENGSWSAADDLATVSVPPTIQALVGARLDRLPTGERSVIERASVEGKLFHREAVSELSPVDARPELGSRLMALVRKELIRPGKATLTGQDAFRFRHQLFRDSAYESLPKELRADLHERFAEWLEASVADSPLDLQEIVGHHLERAFRYREELGALDDSARSTAARASELLVAAGRKADARQDVSAAVGLLTRGVVLLPEDAPERVRVLAELGEALIEAGDLAQAECVIAEAAERASALGDARMEALALLPRVRLQTCTNPQADVAEIKRELEEAIRHLGKAGDDRGLAQAWLRVVHTVESWSEAEPAVERALVHARRAGARREEVQALSFLPSLAVATGTRTVKDGIERCQELLAACEGRLGLEASALAALGILTALSGRIEEGRRLHSRAREIFLELGQRVRYASSATAAARIAVLADDLPAAEAALRESLDILKKMGDKAVLTGIAWRLADVLYEQDRHKEALDLTHLSEQAATAGNYDAQLGWRAVRAKVLARADDPHQAEVLAREAVAIAKGSVDLRTVTIALIALADVLRSLGRPEEMRLCVHEAIEIHDGRETSPPRGSCAGCSRSGRARHLRVPHADRLRAEVAFAPEAQGSARGGSTRAETSRCSTGGSGLALRVSAYTVAGG